MTKKELEILENLLKIFFCEEAKGQGVKELDLNEYTCKDLITAIEEKQTLGQKDIIFSD